MKKKCLMFILSFAFTVAFAQTKRYTKLREFYPMITNVDSLERVVYSYKNEPLRYLQGLIRLEFCRRMNSDKYGQDLETIRNLSEQLKYPLGTAVYEICQAKLLRQKDQAKSFTYTQNALKYFEKNKDTTGIIDCVFKLYSLNFNEFKQKKGDIKLAKQQFDRVVLLGEQTSFIHDKILVKLRNNNSRNNFYKPFSNQEQMAYFNEIESLIQKIDPSVRRAYLSLLYESKANYAGDKRRFDEAMMYYQKSVDYCDYCTPNIISETYRNMAVTYETMRNYKKAEFYHKKNIELFRQHPEKLNLVFIDTYDSYATIMYLKGDYKTAWKYRDTKDSLQRVYDEKVKTEEFVKLQAKYETEKKESTIKTLRLEKQAAESQKWGLIIGLVLLVFIVGIVSFLLLKLQKTNANLLTLQKARDKLYTIIAHDLRSPLNTYQRYSEIVGYLIKTKQFDRLDTTLKQIDEIGLHLASLLNNLLQWSLAQQKQVNFTPKNIHVRQFFDDLLPIYRDMAKLKSVVLIEDFADDDISTDPNTLSLIVRNLLDNAIKYTPEGEKVKIQTYSNEKEFILSLSNKGDTMAKAQKAKIKTLFETAQDFDFGEEGLGVGLILVKQYSKTNHAKVSFENDDNGHTTFKVIVPRMVV